MEIATNPIMDDRWADLERFKKTEWSSVALHVHENDHFNIDKDNLTSIKETF